MKNKEVLKVLKEKEVSTMHIPVERIGKVQICYDIESVPQGIDIESIVEFYQETGWLVYSSKRKKGNYPKRPQLFTSEEFKSKEK